MIPSPHVPRVVLVVDVAVVVVDVVVAVVDVVVRDVVVAVVVEVGGGTVVVVVGGVVAGVVVVVVDGVMTGGSPQVGGLGWTLDLHVRVSLPRRCRHTNRHARAALPLGHDR
jgi:hypothetical protein